MGPFNPFPLKGHLVDWDTSLSFHCLFLCFLLVQLCSVEVECERGAVMAATLANYGQCPITATKVDP